MSRLGDRLRALMGEKTVSRERLAEAGGISADTLDAILAGEIVRPPDSQVRGFAKALGVSSVSLTALLPADGRRGGAHAGFDRARCAVELAMGAPDWVQLLPLGEVRPRAHDSREAWTVGDAEAVVRASRELIHDLPIDYEHQTDNAPTNGQPAPAAGWIEELQARPDGIWGRVRWTERAAAMIDGGEYRFLSPVFEFGKKTREVTRILRAGLTNDPALFLKALASRQAQAHEETMDELLKELRKILGLAEETDRKAVCAAVKDAAEKAKGDGDDKPLAGVAKALGLADDASAEDVETAAAKATAAAAKAGDRDTLAARLEKLEQDTATEKATAKAEAAVKAGKLTPAQRDWAIDYAKRDTDGFDAFLGSQPVIVAPGATIEGGKAPKGADGLSADEMAVCKAMGIEPDAFKKTRDGDEEEAA